MKVEGKSVHVGDEWVFVFTDVGVSSLFHKGETFAARTEDGTLRLVVESVGRGTVVAKAEKAAA